MRKVDNVAVDSELLALFRALAETGSLTQAAGRVGLSQAAASRALSKLRAVFQDQLFVKGGYGMQATPRARELMPRVTAVLQALDHLTMPYEFDPQALRRTLYLGAVDNGVWMIFSRVVKSLFQQAPNARIEILPIGDDLFSSLKFGRMDLAIYPLIDIPPDFHEANLFKTTFSCLVRQGHPLARQMLRGETPTLAQINAYRRLQVSLHDGQPGATVGNAVHRQGEDYDVAMSVPYFLAAPMLLSQTDFVLTLPTQTARHFSQMANLAILPYPDGETTFYTRLIWHHRVHHDPVIQWLRTLFLRFASEEAALESARDNADAAGCRVGAERYTQR
ncbi:LysR family transcriptional regulator [Edwardsiella piscicida]|uniref:LysR family transcriptional regulator n=1 Tax=Edwardsiella piscicida TaxID=1263550 RepID=UPI0029106A0A|nr:LysR family transcriptional regulator [Edwardsiella piscicida]